ncbi:endoplasmic reticulum-resident calcium binding protein [Plasmodium brasilianum]|uniref:Endoplasmic reticulum-resident calcium binding protein, putative n=2 Tax=Plasmodium (Plasmodium) TaxID=418103 RepID=A0A1A8VX85_PLAMA|nr:endoplasmic reticulum-resident calcium binding protein, putative [Plasmodium malariae]KAI4838218.1 endoplasmic reticulum-resident calcium binding protein [Plasmodium brasilianum]SBS85187.1 endoplasmic reticulum-resident calcium binding protein, putative (ERC) [Plasmodium malariae]SCN12614.1 endoplasmic reticulum-resident calcium binding protein, putative [Plasmodium malariae]
MKTYVYNLLVACFVLYLRTNVKAVGGDPMKYADMKGLDDLSNLNDDQVKDILGLNIAEAKERIGKLFNIIDKNKDKILSDDELSTWSNNVKNEVFLKQVQVEMKQIDSDKDGFISLNELNDAFSQNLDAKEVEKHVDGLLKRFQIVDKDKDNKLNINEVGLLIDPMKDEELKELEISEILNHHDVNKDGKISIDEFKRTRTDDPSVKKDDDVALDDFNFFDTNKDGFIDREEIIKVYFDPTHETGSINLNEVKNSIFEGKQITYDLWNDKALKLAVTSLTDYGDILRYPEDFKLDIGKNVVLPSSRKGEAEEEDLDQEDSATDDKDDGAEQKAQTADEL